MRKLPQSKALATTLLSAAVLTGVGSAAQADHGGVKVPPDNTAQAVKGNNLTDKGAEAMRYGMGQLDRSVITTSIGGGDLYVYDGDYGDNGKAGWWKAWYPESTYDRAEIVYNQYYMSGEPLDSWKELACHEFGHSATLAHRTAASDPNDNSCMRTPLGTGGRGFDDHDVNAINNHVD